MLARLSEDPHRTVRMSILAEITTSALSRLSHLMKRLEARELVRRETDPDDGRFTNAILTRAGYAKLVASAPAHVGLVRSLAFDPLTAEDQRDLRDMCTRLVERVGASDG